MSSDAQNHNLILTSLDGSDPPCLPPSNLVNPDPALLGPGFLRVTDEEHAHVLETCLGVARVSPAAFLKTRVLARLDVLPARALDLAMLEALRTLGSLTHHDETISERRERALRAHGLGETIPAESAVRPARARVGGLLAASADVSFPAAPFDDPRVLETLAGLGMRAGVTCAAVLEAALAAERLMRVDAAAAKHQGLAVLRYLETPEGARLLSPEKPSRKAKSLFGSLFAGSAVSFGSKPAAADDTTRRGAEEEEASENAGVLDHRAFVARLARVAWAPVATAPADGDASRRAPSLRRSAQGGARRFRFRRIGRSVFTRRPEWRPEWRPPSGHARVVPPPLGRVAVFRLNARARGGAAVVRGRGRVRVADAAARGDAREAAPRLRGGARDGARRSRRPRVGRRRAPRLRGAHHDARHGGVRGGRHGRSLLAPSSVVSFEERAAHGDDVRRR